MYEDYLTTRDEELCRLLLLHNEEDLKGMPLILPILSYPDFLTGSFTLEEWTVREETDIFGQKESFLEVTCRSRSQAFLLGPPRLLRGELFGGRRPAHPVHPHPGG